MGINAYQHLPGLLKELGYKTIQIGQKKHVDAFRWNMLRSFDYSNAYNLSSNFFDKISEKFGGRLNWEMYFNQIIINRIWERLKHSFGSDLMERSHKPTLDIGRLDGNNIVNNLKSYIQKGNNRPVFVQIHSMLPKLKKDGVLDFFTLVKKIVDYLKQLNRFENSLIVITSDHGKHHSWAVKLPLIINFLKK